MHAQFVRVVDTLGEKLPAVAEHLDAARGDVLAFHRLPQGNLAPGLVEQPARDAQPRYPPPHRRRRHLPDRASLIRLVGVVLAEHHDEWTEMRRYIGLDVLASSRLSLIESPAEHDQEVTSSAITAQSPTQDHAETASHTTSADVPSTAARADPDAQEKVAAGRAVPQLRLRFDSGEASISHSWL